MSEIPTTAAAPSGGLLRRTLDSRGLRIAFLVVAVALGVSLLVSQWDAIRDDIAQLSLWSLAASFVAAAAALMASVGVFRTILADLGSQLSFRSASRVLLVGQLGKYIPGSVWAVIGPGEVARAYAVPRTRSAVAMLLTLAFSLATGLIMAAVTLPIATGDLAHEYALVFAAIPFLLVALHPRIVNAVLAWALRVTRRPPMEHPLSLRGIALGLGWSTAAWIGYGAAIGAIAASLGVDLGTAVLIGIGAFALAWMAGFLVFVAPAGAGVREAVLIAALGPVLDASSSLLVALVDRAIITFAELTLALAAGLLQRRGVARRSES